VLRKSYVAALALLPTLVACSGTHPLSHEELQTEFRASISLTSETEAFLVHLDGHAYSRNFVDGYLFYLQKQGSDIEKDLARVSVPKDDRPSLEVLKTGTGELMQLFGTLQSQDSRARDPMTMERLHLIQQRLEADRLR
jgi:hypothetical protein